MSSVWHRPQCNIGPGISPVTIGTMDDSRKHPGSPGLASSTRRRRANDEINAHSSMLVAMTGAVVVVASVTSSVTHTIHARFRYQEEHQREESSPRLGGSLRRPRRGAAPTVLGVSTRCLSRPSKKLADILRLQPLRDRRFLARYLAGG